MQNANGNLAAFLNVPAVGVAATVGYGTPVTGSKGTEYAHASYWWKPIDPQDSLAKYFDWKLYLDGKCHITIWNQKFQALDETSAEAIITHEVFHCYQQRVAGTGDVAANIPAWIKEGEATWVMAAVVPAVRGTIMDTKWSPYVFGPKTVYSDRSYDAVGVFGHESDLAGDGDVWPKLLPMVGMAAAGEKADNSGAFSMLIKGQESRYYSSWGSSYFESNGNLPRTMNGPGEPPTTGPPPDMVSVNASTNEMLTPTPSYQAQLWQLDGDADIVVVSLYTGYGRLHDNGFGLDTELGNTAGLALCLKRGGCTCPDGTPGASLFTKPATAPISIGVDGGDVTALIGVLGRSLDEFCKKPDPKPPAAPPAPGGGGGGGGGGGDDNQKQPVPPEGGGFGDTHVTTFDGVRYDLQVVGEFTMVRSTKDDFVVQVRQVPAIGSKAASINQAMATKLGRDTVTVTMENGCGGSADQRDNGQRSTTRSEGRSHHAFHQHVRRPL